MPQQPAGISSDPYSGIARWYDAAHDLFADDLQFYRDLAAGAGHNIIEIGCGTGRVTLPLARMGRMITGIDASSAMLERCHERLAAEPAAVRQRVRLIHADALALADEAAGPFGLAIIPLNTFAHFVTPADRQAVLARLRGRLVPGGRLVLDLDMQGPRRLLESPGLLWLMGTWEEAGAGAPAERVGVTQVTHLASAVPAPEWGDVALVTHLYDAQTADGAVRRTISRMALALLGRGEMALTLEQAGYRVEDVYGSYELDPYEPGAERAIFVAHTAP
jgi:SAM-dependent methyltransferase